MWQFGAARNSGEHSSKLFPPVSQPGLRDSSKMDRVCSLLGDDSKEITINFRIRSSHDESSKTRKGPNETLITVHFTLNTVYIRQCKKNGEMIHQTWINLKILRINRDTLSMSLLGYI